MTDVGPAGQCADQRLAGDHGEQGSFGRLSVLCEWRQVILGDAVLPVRALISRSPFMFPSISRRSGAGSHQL